MELIVNDPTWAGDFGDYEEYKVNLRNELSSIDNEFTTAEGNIGRGADWPIILATFLGLFFLGKPINENIDAWIALSSKFSSALKRIAKKFGVYRIDERGANLLAINEILKEDATPTSVILLSSYSIPIAPLDWNPEDKLTHKPDAYYVDMFDVNNSVIYIFIIKSTGDVEIKHRLELPDWMDFPASKDRDE